MAPATDPVDWDTPTRVHGDWVTVERSLDRDEEAVIATVEVTTEAESPVSVEVCDAFPDEWAASEVGVHPEYVPESFVADAHRIKFTDTVAPDSPIEVVYGVKLDSTDALQPPSPPEIRSERGLEALLDAERADVEADGGRPPLETAGEPDERAVDPPTQADGDGSSVWDAASTDDGKRERSDAPLLSSDGAGTDEAGSADEDAGFGFDRAAEERIGAEGDLVDRLVDDLESRPASDDAVAALREAVGREGSNRDSVRLDHLQSRVEEFAAYADMLGDLIDEHGTLDGVFDDFDDRLGALEGEFDGIRTTLEEASDDRDTLRNRLAATADRVDAVDDVADDVDAVREEVSQLRRDHRQELDDLGTTVDALEADLDEAIDTIQTNVASIEDRVEAWDEARQRLVDVLEPDREG